MQLLWMEVARQYGRYVTGDLSQHGLIEPLFRLYGIIKVGVCRHTRTLEMREMPNLFLALQELPQDMRLPLEAAIQQEWVGRDFVTGLLPPPPPKPAH